MIQTKVIDNNVGDHNTSSDPVNDSAVKRLLRKENLTGAQIGRILFLNIHEMIEGHKQLYTYEEYAELVRKLDDENEFKNFVFYQRLTTYAVNEINELMIRNELSLKGLKYIYSELRLHKLDEKHKLDYLEIKSTINDIRLNLKYINSYALFYDAVKKLLKDRRLKSEYRITKQAHKVIKETAKFNEYIDNLGKKEAKELKLYSIGKISEVYIEYKPRPEVINKIINYLRVVFDPSTNIGNVTVSNVAKYLNQEFSKK